MKQKEKAQKVYDNENAKLQEVQDATAALGEAIEAYTKATVAGISDLRAPELSMSGTTTGAITGYTKLAGETLNVTSAATNYVTVDAPTGLDLTAVAQGSSVITVQVLVDGHVVKTGTVNVTVGA